jgi:hypothetical protein
VFVCRTRLNSALIGGLRIPYLSIVAFFHKRNQWLARIAIFRRFGKTWPIGAAGASGVPSEK